jgi:hypothetical protein
MEPVCSFCGERPVVAWFEGPDFRTRVSSPDEVRAEEAWLACATCLRLVDANDRESLAVRGSGALARHNGQLAPEQYVEAMRSYFDAAFWMAGQ